MFYLENHGIESMVELAGVSLQAESLLIIPVVPTPK
jgi:hypothetical protein